MAHAMNRKRVNGRRLAALIVIVAAAAAVAVAAIAKKRAAAAREQFQTEAIARGTLENVVSSTGVIQAVGTVEIGTQVSGTIASLYVDFNDRVRAGQLLAVLDTVPLLASVLDAHASLRRAEAQLEKAEYDYRQNLPLFEKGLVSESEFMTMKTNVPSQEASVQSARASLERAKFNFANAFIRAPISGTVIERNVEQGQTVAASFNTPKLFLIAEDLSRVEIHAQVDESDIGQIKGDLAVRFEVPAYPDRIFLGKVKQIRLVPTVIQNVVNYAVIVDASNDKGLLLPGMTATVDFLVEQRENVLLVPNAAMQFQATPAMQEEARRQMQKRLESAPDSVKSRFAARGDRQGGNGGERRGDAASPQGGASAPGAEAGSPGTGRMQGGGMSADMVRIWYVNDQGKPAMAMFRKGVTDGKYTEVLRSRDLDEGVKVILGYAVTNPDKKKAQATQAFRPRMF
jgi:HlyD family secretion protein